MTESWKPSLEDETVEPHTVYEVDADKHIHTESLTDESILEALREHFQTKVNNLSGDEMAEGPFEDPDETLETFGDRWEAAASRIDARGGLRIKFFFADQEGGC